MTTPEPSDRTSLRLTDRGRMAVSLAVCLVLLATLALIDHGVGHERVAAVSHPQPTASPSASASGQAEGGASSISGMVHTGLLGTGTWTASTLGIAPAGAEPRMHALVVKAEGGTGIDANDAPRQVMAVPNDPRGWPGHEGQGLRLVTDPAKAGFTVHLASPGRVQKTGAGQPAPVMMQQSKTLGACVATAWSTTGERG